MSANRLSWIVSGVVVLVVGVFVVRTLQRDTATRVAGSRPPRASAPAHGGQTEPRPAGSDSGKAAADKISSVERAKLALKERGYYSGPIDGNYDPPMMESLKRFQAASGMKATGYLDRQTYAALGIELGRRQP